MLSYFTLLWADCVQDNEYGDVDGAGVVYDDTSKILDCADDAVITWGEVSIGSVS